MTLDGNWQLAGSRSAKQFPQLSMSLLVNGSQILAAGSMDTQCTGSFFTAGGGFSLAGTIAGDGTFQLTDAFPPPSTPPLPGLVHISIQGRVPRQGDLSWTGSYTLSNGGTNSTCGVNQAGSFQAVSLPPVSGTYVGSVSGNASSSKVSIQIAQQPAVERTTPTHSTFYVPLNGTITIQNAACSMQGKTSSPSFLSLLSGDQLILQFTMDDGSTVLGLGYLNDASETEIILNALGTVEGKCHGVFQSGTLTKQ
ncbi:hypothetical protein HDF10_001370 [Edaphobacter lichenicola]|uniref:Uncharacterized protein n=2 Tax=Tunturiibacter TaxID=3154218 RepID=A0A7W8J667_9BACT|nr:hypothetical protein [Edaphobacter lichenicola]